MDSSFVHVISSNDGSRKLKHTLQSLPRKISDKMTAWTSLTMIKLTSLQNCRIWNCFYMLFFALITRSKIVDRSRGLSLHHVPHYDRCTKTMFRSVDLDSSSLATFSKTEYRKQENEKTRKNTALHMNYL